MDGAGIGVLPLGTGRERCSRSKPDPRNQAGDHHTESSRVRTAMGAIIGHQGRGFLAQLSESASSYHDTDCIGSILIYCSEGEAGAQRIPRDLFFVSR